MDKQIELPNQFINNCSSTVPQMAVTLITNSYIKGHSGCVVCSHGSVHHNGITYNRVCSQSMSPTLDGWIELNMVTKPT